MKLQQILSTKLANLQINITVLTSSFIFGAFVLYFQYKFSTLPVMTTEVLKSLALATIIFLLPDIITGLLKKKDRPMYIPFAIILLAGIGLVIKIPFAFLLLIASLLIIYTFLSIIKTKIISFKKIPNYMSVLIIIIIISIYLITLVYGTTGYFNPLFIERLIAGEGSLDTLWHTAYTNIFLNSYIPSVGLHSNHYDHYHYFSHIIFAGLSNLVNVSPHTFYNLFYPVIFIPLFIKSILIFSKNIIKSYNIYISYLVQLFVVAFSILILFQFVLGWTTHHLVSVSYTLSIIFSIFFITEYFNISINTKKNPKQIFLLIIIGILMFAIIMFLKSSTGFIFFVMLGYLIFRLFSLKHYAIYCFGILGFVLTLTNYFLFYRVENVAWYSIKHFIFFEINAFILPLVLIILVFVKDRLLEQTENWMKLIKNKNLIFLELIILTTLFSFIPVLALNKSVGSNVNYFASYPPIMGIVTIVPIILIYISSFIKHIKLSIKTKNVIILLLSIFFLIYNYRSFTIGYGIIPKSNIKTKQNANKYAMLVTKLKDMKYKEETIFYVHKTNKLFWNNWAEFNNEKTFFTIQALTGMPQLYAIPYDKTDRLSNFYNFGYYRKNVPKAENFSDVLNEAKRLNYKNLIVITDSLDLKTYKIYR